MKRALLIAGGTVGGLGAVLAITPPQLSSGDLNIAGGTALGSVSTSASASSSTNAVATQTATKSSKPVATKKATAAASASASASSTATATPAADAAPAAQAAPAAINGTFTGPSVFVNYGNVQVKITVVNGRITDAVAVKAPSGKNDRYTNMAVPILKQQTLAAQSANIKGASGASYTSYGWFTSLQGALSQAGL
jgi:uncharacterized protein with FMN-binding domain